MLLYSALDRQKCLLYQIISLLATFGGLSLNRSSANANFSYLRYLENLTVVRHTYFPDLDGVLTIILLPICILKTGRAVAICALQLSIYGELFAYSMTIGTSRTAVCLSKVTQIRRKSKRKFIIIT